MREIKFRAWNNISKTMLLWEELRADKELLMSFFGNEAYMTHSPTYFWERMQYTGLKDKNGKEIYEGDIVKHEDWKPPQNDSFSNDWLLWVIEWTDQTYSENPQWHPTNGGNGCYNEYYGDWEPNCFEVIGNIHENSDLLNETNP